MPPESTATQYYSITKEPKQVIEFLRREPVSTRQRIDDAIDSLQSNPRPPEHESFQVGLSPTLKLPVSNGWFLMYQVDDTTMKVYVLAVIKQNQEQAADTRENEVFISYAWGDEREVIVNQIDQALQARGLTIKRDRRDLGYKGSIKAFMERIGRGNCVILVISDKYLRSPNCMFELVEVAENEEFHDRIFPVVLADAEIYGPVNQSQYIRHWDDKINEIKETLKTLDPTHLEGIYEQLNLYTRIRHNISRLTATLSDMNTLTPEMHRESNFSYLFDAIEKRMKGSQE